ncbi:rna-directed rna polymerase (sad-1) [Diplodia corticola]|uniref:Rna-directed rna polymerase (Sad-1) n=1 Tax=Diplodia corticola TaxID=236234 RepID=A0A1J9QZZ6_9PEZI|nr:rna-directed rna polymerase (sad-1) [Diplodia corticola]OJD33937.1 rna-directed rna polymerase (sad-1) [Diplodia corticola]
MNFRRQPSTPPSFAVPSNFRTHQRPGSGYRMQRVTPSPPYPPFPVGPHPISTPPQSRPQPRKVMQNDDWKKWQDLKIKVHNLPVGINTVDVYKLFKHEGTISKIDIVSESNGKVAYVVFSPPPLRSFWEDQWSLPWRQPGSGIPLRVEARGQVRYSLKNSPTNPNKKYPEIMTVSAKSVDFGFMYGESAMMNMQNASKIRPHNVAITLNLKWNRLTVHFPLDLFNEEKNFHVTQQYRFEIPIQRLSRVHEAREGDKRVLIIPSDYVPSFFRKVEHVESTHETGESFWSDSKAWYRQVDITHLRTPLKTASITLRKKTPVIDIGHWTTYKIDFDSSSTDLTRYDEILSALADWNVNIVADTPITLLEREQSTMWDVIDGPKSPSLFGKASSYDLEPEPISLDFELRYQLEACLSNNILNEHNISADFLQRLSKMNSETAKAYLKVAMQKKQRFYEPQDIFKLPLGKKGMPREIPAHCTWSHAVTVTPSTVIISSPSMEISNRVIRDYIKFSDRFLRVKFTDEKHEGRLRNGNGDRDLELLTRVWRTLRNGITIGGRHYEFLAFGNSQFRENGAYFFSSVEGETDEEDNLTASYIRECMGDFSQIKEVARYASRMGQCFSTTRAVTGVKALIDGAEDVTRNGYTFTDGVGKISQLLAQQVAEEFGHPNPIEDTPSVFQFRLGGCKGILAVAPELDGHQIIVRRSQEKFPAANDGLEVIKWSQYATATLNRQLIVVLDALGVPGYVFMNKLRNQLSGLTNAMTSEEVALRFLQRSVDPIQTTLVLANMIMDGFMGVKEPFLMSVLHVWRAWSIKNLKEKAKLFIGEGAFLLGCADETASLRGHYYSDQKQIHGAKGLIPETLPEIFVQASDPDHEGRYKVIEGVCLVARNPSLHPGDIRVVHAVDKPQLRHLKNVIVFPQTGDRDVPNMCSGGDLDGDDYLVIWDKELIPVIINHPPMDFTPPGKQIVDEVTMEDITRFFVEYIKNDSLGQIANSHLAMADFEDEGVRSDKCLELAQLHSIAVDYPKSGVPAQMAKDNRPKRYPHFMEKHPDRTYFSRRILGQLYDAVEEVKFKPFYDLPFDSRIINAYTIEAEVLARAASVKELYDTAIRRLMAQHDINTEFEAWSTFILKHNDKIRDYSLQEEFGRVWEALRERFQKLCYEEAAGGYKGDAHGPDAKNARAALQEEGRIFKNLGPFIAAMYTVTAQEMQRAVDQTRQTKVVGGRDIPAMKMTPEKMPLMSFPWIFARELGLIATGAKGQPQGLSIQHSIPKLKQTGKQKPKMDTSAQGGWTRDDELFVDGGAVIKQGDLVHLFGDSSKAGHGQQSAHIAHGKDTLKDVCSMPTEPTTSSMTNGMKQLEGLNFFPDENKADQEAAKPAESPTAGKGKMVEKEDEEEEEEEEEDDDDDPEGLYTDDGPYPHESYKYPYFWANAVRADSSKDRILSTIKSSEPSDSRRQIVNPASGSDQSDDDGELVIGAEEETEVDRRKILGRGGRRSSTVAGSESSVQSIAELMMLRRMEQELEERAVVGTSGSREGEYEVKEFEKDHEKEKAVEGGITTKRSADENGKGDKKMAAHSRGSDETGEEEVVIPKKRLKTTWDRLKRFA